MEYSIIRRMGNLYKTTLRIDEIDKGEIDKSQEQEELKPETKFLSFEFQDEDLQTCI